MQEDAVVGSLAYFPVSQLGQAERSAWREGVEASSVMYRPAGQSVQDVEARIEYFPEGQVVQGSPSPVYVPTPHIVQSEALS